MSYNWTVATDENSGNGYVVNRIGTDIPEYTRGAKLTAAFEFWHDSSVDASQGDHVTRYENVRQYADFAGAITIKQSITGKLSLVERVPGSAPVPSVIIDLDPGSSYTTTPGLWVAIQGATDQTEYPDDTCRIELDLTILGELSDYADRTALRNDLEAGNF